MTTRNNCWVRDVLSGTLDRQNDRVTDALVLQTDDCIGGQIKPATTIVYSTDDDLIADTTLSHPHQIGIREGQLRGDMVGMFDRPCLPFRLQFFLRADESTSQGSRGGSNKGSRPGVTMTRANGGSGDGTQSRSQRGRRLRVRHPLAADHYGQPQKQQAELPKKMPGDEEFSHRLAFRRTIGPVQGLVPCAGMMKTVQNPANVEAIESAVA